MASLTNGPNPPLPTSTETIGKDCRQCLSFLARALDPSGRPHSLLKALGVVPDSPAIDNGNDDTQTLYKPTPDGRGIAIQLSHTSPAATNDTHVAQQQQPQTSHVSLKRRITNAATRIVDGITIPVIGNPYGNTPVLTTSPALDSTHSSSASLEGITPPMGTTVTIECQTCGCETRAEAGARAYVRGPNPLSIILCSNRLSTQGEVNEVLVHELIHVYDIFSRQMDLRQCHALAYSEVRAARDAECSGSLTTFTRNICAKDKATVATKNMFPEEGRGCVCDVFDRAIRDVAPLGAASDGGGGGGAAGDSRRIDGGKSSLGGGGLKTGKTGDESAFRPKEARPSER
ncbi:hypothetical protein HJC23_008924 [Cyclotella cryptica]|uniref:Mitochondrial inner membrane protease ATP23 n=1 Tax=Cyclotella cryptica TaxID=29204 RepID=A0ABD3Q264_9STRA